MSWLFGLGREPEPSAIANSSLDAYTQTNGCLKIYLPDGHLYRGEKEPIGAGEEIWKHTGFPYGTLNHSQTPIGETRGDNVYLEPHHLRDLGYIADGLKLVILSIRRPQQIPESVAIEGMGISGKDWISDGLNIPLINGVTEDEFKAQLFGTYHIQTTGSLEYRPSHLVVAFPVRYGIETYDDVIREARSYRRESRKPIRIASEFPTLTGLAMERLIGLSKDEYELKLTHGKTEGFVLNGDSEGMLDIAESGGSILRNGIRAVRPAVMEVSTPYLLINDRTRTEYFDPFITQLIARIDEGKEIVKGEHPELFEDRLDDRIYNPPESV
jgi:ATP phosphoribosyltransferase